MLRARSDGGGKVRKSGRGGGQSAGSSGPGGSGTWSPTDKSASVTLSGGNLIATLGNPGNSFIGRATVPYSSGDRYFEVTVNLGTSTTQKGVGLAKAAMGVDGTFPGGDTNGAFFRDHGYLMYNSAYVISNGVALVNGDVMGFRYNGATPLLTVYKNGVSLGTYALPNAAWIPMIGSTSNGDNGTGTINLGTSNFAYPVAGTTAWGA